MTTATAPDRSARRSALWAPERRATTAGFLLLVTIEAFEALSVGTALPTLVRDLHGEAWYSWPFTAFLVASTVGTVLAGRWCDRRGPVPALLIGPALFLAGLLIAGTVPTMAVLLAGRVVQGAAAGVQTVALFVALARVYPERDRPAVFGSLSAAWVLPALVGPMIAGLLTEYLSWRWVFLGLTPLVALGIGLLLPVVRRLAGGGAGSDAGGGGAGDGGAGDGDGDDGNGGEAGDRGAERTAESAAPRRGVLAAALAAAAALTLLVWSGQHPSVPALAGGALGLALLVPALRRLLPRGTLTGRPGLPLMVLSRGVLSAVFFGAQAYLPLTLSAVHGFSPAQAGLPLTVTAAGWFAGAQWQGSRGGGAQRVVLVRAGLVLIAVALAAVALVALPGVPGWAALPLWVIAGCGMGLAMPSASVRILELSPLGDQGANSSAAQIADQLAQVLSIGVGGMLVNLLASTADPTAAVLPFDLALAVLAGSGAMLLRRRGGTPM